VQSITDLTTRFRKLIGEYNPMRIIKEIKWKLEKMKYLDLYLHGSPNISIKYFMNSTKNKVMPFIKTTAYTKNSNGSDLSSSSVTNRPIYFSMLQYYDNITEIEYTKFVNAVNSFSTFIYNKNGFTKVELLPVEALTKKPNVLYPLTTSMPDPVIRSIMSRSIAGTAKVNLINEIQFRMNKNQFMTNSLRILKLMIGFTHIFKFTNSGVDNMTRRIIYTNLVDNLIGRHDNYSFKDINYSYNVGDIIYSTVFNKLQYELQSIQINRNTERNWKVL